MNTKDFVQVLRKIIKEEVKSAVKEAISDINTNSLLENVIVDDTVEYKAPVKRSTTKKQFTKDPLLNSLLNETAAAGAHIPTEHNDFDEWPTMKMNSYASLMGSPKFVDNKKIDATPDGINPNAVPEEVKGALTRDYRSLMKAIDKKKGK